MLAPCRGSHRSRGPGSRVRRLSALGWHLALPRLGWRSIHMNVILALVGHQGPLERWLDVAMSAAPRCQRQGTTLRPPGVATASRLWMAISS